MTERNYTGDIRTADHPGTVRGILRGLYTDETNSSQQKDLYALWVQEAGYTERPENTLRKWARRFNNMGLDIFHHMDKDNTQALLRALTRSEDGTAQALNPEHIQTFLEDQQGGRA